MGTRIRRIYELLADVPVRLHDELVGCWTPDTMHNRVNSAALPLRILSPIGTAESGTITPVVFDPAPDGGEIQWTIYELVLLGTAPEGRGMRGHTDDMLELSIQYTNAIFDSGARLMRGVLWQSFTVESGIYTYNNVDYFAVEMRHQITEILG